MQSLKKYLQNQQFNPGFLGIFINPFYIVRRELYKAMRHFSEYISGKTLDVGCGHRPYEHLFSQSQKYIGLEYDSAVNRARFSKIDAWYDGLHFPFNDSEFDSIIITQVLEHVFNPDTFLTEVARVTKPGGHVLLTVPFVWDEHEQPWDYARYSSFGLIHLLKKHGFEIVEHLKTAPDTRVIFQLINCYIHKKLQWIRSYRVRLIFFTFFTFPFTLLGIISSIILPSNSDLYMDNVVLAQKKKK